MRPRKQHRRSVSMTAATYDRIKAFCESNGISMSSLVEARVNEAIDAPAKHEDLMTPPQCSRCGRIEAPGCCSDGPGTARRVP